MMPDIQKQLDDLQQQIYSYKQRQIQMFKELQDMERELERLQFLLAPATQETSILSDLITEPAPPPFKPAQVKVEVPPSPIFNPRLEKQQQEFKQTSRGLEDFIGTNLISKVGIIITIIGIFIGAKYAIDNELISPFMRILLGYIAAASLIIIAIKLKEKYQYFSSILMGGGLAVIYFITYIAFDFYQIFPQAVAFFLMLITTASTVAIAIWYNQKIIAILGQVGAYAIPFLLSNNSGNVLVLFSYISIINIGLLFLSFKKDWKIVYRVAFYLSWFIYAIWITNGDYKNISFINVLIFLTVNFLTFYGTFLSYKILRREDFKLYEIIVLLLNSLIYFFLGVYFISENYPAAHTLTWFTLINAIIHAAIGISIYKLKLFDKTVIHFVIALAILFITISIPIELDGNWVTLLWTIEGLLLYMIGYKNKRVLYVQVAAPVLIVALISLLQDWLVTYSYLEGSINYTAFGAIPFANLNFWLSMLVAAIMGVVVFIHSISGFKLNKGYTSKFYNTVLPLAFFAIVYLNIYHEIHYAWDKVIAGLGKSAENNQGNYNLMRSISLIIYTCIFVAILMFINARFFKKEKLYQLFLIAAILTSVQVLLKSLYEIGELRENYLLQKQSLSNVYLFRYGTILSLAALWASTVSATRRFSISAKGEVIRSMAFNITLLSLLCSEFIHWMDIAGYSNQYKLGITIICGLYALALLISGFAKKKKHLRIAAIILFAATILKLFIYDLASLSTISKTIVLVILGVLLLVASFLYNKYKDLLFDAPISDDIDSTDKNT